MYTHTHTYIWYVLIALSRGSDPLHVRRFRADHPRSKSWWYRGWNVTWILGINRASTRAPQIINSSAASLSNAIPSFPRWPSSSTSVIDGSARRERSRRGYERLGPLISTLAEEREGRMLNRNRFFPFSYLRNWWVESIFFENCVFLSSFLFIYLFLRRFCASLPFAEIRESNLVVLVSVKIKLKVKEMGGRWDIIRNDRLFRIGSFFFLRKNSFLVELKVMYSV